LVRAKKVHAFETERIVRPPDVVKCPPHLPKLEIYPAFIISVDINCFRVRLNQLGHGLPLVDPVHKCRKTKIEVGILRDRQSSVVIVTIYKDKIPMNVGQLKRGD